MKLKKLKELLIVIKKEFSDVYIVGGILRDFFLQKNFSLEKLNVIDIDVVIKNLDTKKLKNISFKFCLPFVTLDENNKIYRIVIKEEQRLINIDFSNYEDLTQDVLRRDFTINTLYLKLNFFIEFLTTGNKNIVKKNVVDLVGAKKDIKLKVLKVVTERSFQEDPLRILRLVRFATYGFKVEKNTESMINKNLKLLSSVSKERIAEEIKKIFNSLPSYKIFDWMDKNGILDTIFPEIKFVKIKGKNTQFRQFYFHKEGLWQHIKLTYKYLEYVLNNLKKFFPQYCEEINMKIKDKIYILKFISLFHDIAKPIVVSKQKGRVRFFHHEIKSAVIAQKVLSNLRYSKQEINIICNVIKNHMRVGGLYNNKEHLTERAYLRLFNDIGDAGLYYLILFSLADRLSYSVIPLSKRKQYFKNCYDIKDFIKFENYILQKYNEFLKIKNLPRLLTGYDVMNIFGIPEGPLVGKILNFIREAQLLNKISTKQQAIKLAKKYINTLKIM